MKYFNYVIPLLLLSLGLPLGGNAQIDKFVLGMYCQDYDGSPAAPFLDPVGLDKDYLEALTALHFNMAIAELQLKSPTPSYVSSHPSLDFLDRAYEANLDIWLNVPEIEIHRGCPVTTTSTSPSVLQNAFNYYETKPALKAYTLYDEPRADHFAAIAPVMQAIDQYSNGRVGYVNHLAMGSLATGQWAYCGGPAGTIYPSQLQAYDTFLEEFITTCRPKFLAYDDYPFYDIAPIGVWYCRFYHAGLWTMANKAREHNLPYMQVICPFRPSGPNALAGIDEIGKWNFMYYTALMYGAKGIIQWKREINGQNAFEHGYGADDGVELATRQHIGELNEKIAKHQDILLDLHFEDAYHTGNHDAANVNLGNIYAPQMCDPVNGCSQALSMLPWNIDQNLTNFQSTYGAQASFNAIGLKHLKRKIVLGAEIVDPFEGLSSLQSDISKLSLSMLHDSYGGEYFFILNNDVETPNGYTNFLFNFNAPKRVVNVFEDEICENISYMLVHLEPGEGKLFQVQAMRACTNQWCNVSYPPGPTDPRTEICTVMDIAGTACQAEYMDGSHTRQLAGSIILEAGTFAELGSDVVWKAYTPAANCGFHKRHLDASPSPQPLSTAVDAFKVFPNPSEGTFNLSGLFASDTKVQIRVLDVNGVLIMQETDHPSSGAYHHTIDLGHQAAGVYMLEVVSDLQVRRFKLVKL